jgi:hypothetical protein
MLPVCRSFYSRLHSESPLSREASWLLYSDLSINFRNSWKSLTKTHTPNDTKMKTVGKIEVCRFQFQFQVSSTLINLKFDENYYNDAMITVLVSFFCFLHNHNFHGIAIKHQQLLYIYIGRKKLYIFIFFLSSSAKWTCSSAITVYNNVVGFCIRCLLKYRLHGSTLWANTWAKNEWTHLALALCLGRWW